MWLANDRGGGQLLRAENHLPAESHIQMIHRRVLQQKGQKVIGLRVQLLDRRQRARIYASRPFQKTTRIRIDQKGVQLHHGHLYHLHTTPHHPNTPPHVRHPLHVRASYHLLQRLVFDNRLQRRQLEDALRELLEAAHDRLARRLAARRQLLLAVAPHDMQPKLHAVFQNVREALRAVVLELQEGVRRLLRLLQWHAPDQQVVSVERQRHLHAVLARREVDAHLLVAAARAAPRHHNLRVALGQQPLRLVLAELDLPLILHHVAYELRQVAAADAHRVRHLLARHVLLCLTHQRRVYATQKHAGVPETADGVEHTVVGVLEEDGAAAEGTTLADGAQPEEPAQIADVLLRIHLLIVDDLRMREWGGAHLLVDVVTVHNMLADHLPGVKKTAARKKGRCLV